jgi:hypothetical protein
MECPPQNPGFYDSIGEHGFNLVDVFLDAFGILVVEFIIDFDLEIPLPLG